jgi:hypothetical protein
MKNLCALFLAVKELIRSAHRPELAEDCVMTAQTVRDIAADGFRSSKRWKQAIPLPPLRR